MPMRHKEVHFLNLPTPLKYVYDFCRSRFSQKIRSRFMVSVDRCGWTNGLAGARCTVHPGQDFFTEFQQAIPKLSTRIQVETGKALTAHAQTVSAGRAHAQ